MKELRGKTWIQSDQKTESEEQIVHRLMPIARIASTLAIASVAAAEPHHTPLTRQDRCLVPGFDYQITKIGDYQSGDKTQRGNRVSALLAASMLDELPHLYSILEGNASINGPRGTEPEHRKRLFDALAPDQREEWAEILGLQKQGLISSYALEVHVKPVNFETTAPESTLNDREVLREATSRFNADRYDFEHASAMYDAYLRKKFVKMVLSRATGGRIGLS